VIGLGVQLEDVMMHRFSWLLAVLAGVFLLDATGASAQRGNRPQKNNNNAPAQPAYKPPDDKRLLELQAQLLRDADKLAVEYQRNKQLDKARVCYEEMLRFVPINAKAAASLQKIRGTEATAERKIIEVQANKGWQDTGIDVAEGRPLQFRADGKWHLLMDYPKLSPEGIEIPKELRKFNLGSLIGLVVPPDMTPAEAMRRAAEADSADETKAEEPKPEQPAAAPAEGEAKADAADTSVATTEEKPAEQKQETVRPFFVGKQLDLAAPNSGRLYLRMYDNQPDDNTGKLHVLITGTFGLPPEPPSSAKEPFAAPSAATESR
jgi:hypothetical protein